MPPGLAGRPYGECVAHLMLSQRLLALGLYRRKSENPGGHTAGGAGAHQTALPQREARLAVCMRRQARTATQSQPAAPYGPLTRELSLCRCPACGHPGPLLAPCMLQPLRHLDMHTWACLCALPAEPRIIHLPMCPAGTRLSYVVCNPQWHEALEATDRVFVLRPRETTGRPAGSG